jgi:hypothetical protein
VSVLLGPGDLLEHHFIMSKSRFDSGVAVLFASLALGVTALPVTADDLSRAAAEGGYTVYGPTCRFAACWAVIADSTGAGTVLRGRGVIGTRALIARRLDAMTAADKDVKPVQGCIITAGGFDL